MWRAVFSFAFGFAIAYWLKEQTEEAPLEQPDVTVDYMAEPTAVVEPTPRPEPVVLTLMKDTAVSPDDLTKIKGIGKVFAQRLQDGGIATYAQLSMATAEKVHELLEVKEWQKVDIVAWQTQAAELASD